jgi:hypothetical protein
MNDAVPGGETMKLQRYEPELYKVTGTTVSVQMVESECGSWINDSDAEDMEAELTERRAEGAANFTAGAKAMFDWMMIRVVNHWHGNPEVDKECQAENAVITQWATDALEDVSPESCATWRNIDVMAAQIRELEAENERLTFLWNRVEGKNGYHEATGAANV